VALIAVVCIAAVTLLGKSASSKFSSVASAIS
jgi:Flp pilus assembly pilin Flp